MSEGETKHISLALYQYMCRNIVGSEQTVKTKRLMITVQDNLKYNEADVKITSGSYGEGLELKGSDLDYMYVVKYLKVYENELNDDIDLSQTQFRIDSDDTRIGFVKLLLQNGVSKNIRDLCLKKKDRMWLSNNLFKQYYGKLCFPFLPRIRAVNHGPCFSDIEGEFDFAFCLHCSSWISQADQWKTRPRGSWPSNEVVSTIIEHGVLFVPIGVKGSPNEEIEWRISFSVGEKFLIYSFNHTQLLCYALLKIVLKDIISTDIRCKDLLCSYYLKNILFWVSEETPLSSWKPHNLIQCFMRCFKRLLYCVEYSICSHYFIPKNNMFENKIEGRSRQFLLDNLYSLYYFDWRCILFSPHLQEFQSGTFIPNEYYQLFPDYFEQINSSRTSYFTDIRINFERTVQKILNYQTPSIKLYHYYFLLYSFQVKADELQIIKTDSNKYLYSKYKTCEAYLVQALRCDAVSGWLMLASFYYKMNQYRKVLSILAYALSKCSQEMIYRPSKLSYTQRKLLSSNILPRKGLIRILQLLRFGVVLFNVNSTLIPSELKIETLHGSRFMPHVVFAHLLSFLCHYHLKETRDWRRSLTTLHLTIENNFFIASVPEKSIAYNILGVAYQMVGDKELAREAFQNAITLEPNGLYSLASQRLIMI